MPQDPSGGQFGFFVTPISANKPNNPTPSLRRKPPSSGGVCEGRSAVVDSGFRRSDGRGVAKAVYLRLVLTIRQCHPSLVAKTKLPARRPLQGIFVPQACGIRHSCFGLTTEAGITPLSRQGRGRNTRVRVLLSGGITHCSLLLRPPLQTTPSTGKHLVVYRPTHDFWHWCWGGWFSYYGWRPFQTHLFLCPGGSEGLVGPLAFLHSILQEQTS